MISPDSIWFESNAEAQRSLSYAEYCFLRVLCASAFYNNAWGMRNNKKTYAISQLSHFDSAQCEAMHFMLSGVEA